MNDPPRYLKSLKDNFHQLKSKTRGGKQYVKCNLVHDVPLEDLVKTLKEELDEFKFFMRAQPI